MGIVKYTGPVASFHCPTNAEIRSLKVHFSPKQEGSGDPSPENVRPIVGWDGVETYNRRKNVWDEQWEVGALNYTTGFPTEDSSRIRTKNFNPILPNTSYYFLDPTNGGNINVFWYNINKEFIQISGWTGNREITSPSNAYYFKFIMAASYGAIYNHNISVNYPSTATSYEPYQGETTNYEFGVLGKNKLNADAEQQSPSDTTSTPATKRIFTPNMYCVGMSWSNYYFPNQVTAYSVSNGTITITNNNVYGLGYPVQVAVGQTYYLSAITTNGRAHIAYFAADGTYVSGASTNILNSSFTVPNDVKTAVIIFHSNDGEATFSNIQLELGSTATTYEPYDPKHTVYGGWVDLITGEVCEEYACYTDIWGNGTNGTILGSNERRLFRINISFASVGSTHLALCNMINEFSRDTSTYNEDKSTYSPGNSLIIAKLPVGTSDNVVIQFLSELATPNTYQLAPIQLQTFLGQNNVWSNTDYVEVEYDLHETQSILARKQYIMANQPHIVKPAAAPLQSFATDLAAPLKECKVRFEPKQDLHGYSNPWVGGTGKNLLDMSDSNIVVGSYINNSGVINSHGSNFYNSKYIPVKVNTDYTLSTNTAISYCSFMEYDENKQFIQRTLFGAATPAITSETITTTANTAYVLIGSNVKSSTITLSNIKAISWQFEQGSTATSYEPYENICPISGWDGVEITRCGKNLYDGTISRLGFASNSDSATGYAILTNNNLIGYYCKCKPGEPMTVSRASGTSTSRFSIGFTKEIPSARTALYNMFLPLSNTNTNITMTAPDDAKYVCLYLSNSDNDVSAAKIQLEYGSVATEYEPYQPISAIPIDWTDSAGTVYGGYVDLVSGEVVADRMIKQLTSSANFVSTDDTNNVYVRDFLPIKQNYYPGLCTHSIIWNGLGNAPSQPYIELGVRSSATLNWIGIKAALNISTIQEFKDWLDTQTVMVIVPLATPVTYQLTPTQLKTLCGTNNIWSNANDNISVSYWTH